MKARSFTRAKIKLIVCCIWLFSIVIMMPMLFVTKYEEIFLPENMRQIDIALFDSLFICKEQWPNFEFKLVYNI